MKYLYFFLVLWLITALNNVIMPKNDIIINEEICWETIVEEYEYNTRIEGIKFKINYLHPRLEVSEKLSDAIYRSSIKYEIPEDLLIALIYTESSFRKYAKSHANCVGYMQIHPYVHTWIDRSRMYETYYNIDCGSRILREYYDIDNNWEFALIRYNGWVPGSNFGRLVLNRKQKLRSL